MKFSLICALTLEFVGNLISLDEDEVGNNVKGNKGVETSFSTEPVNNVESSPIIADSIAIRDNAPSTLSQFTEDIPLHEHTEHKLVTGVQPAFLKKRSGIVENPPWARANKETDITDEGQPSLPSEPFEVLNFTLIHPLIQSEVYCRTIYDVNAVEQLMFLDTITVRPGGNWWKVLGLILKDGGIKVNRPMCASFPLNGTAVLNRQLSTHEFFQIRGIDVPIVRGRHGYRLVAYTTRDEESVKRDVMECSCKIQESDTFTDTQRSEQNNICVQGKIINLSRGVGGDQSFFVYKFNPSSKLLNVVAHICSTEH